jgi:mannitol-1-phosphate 5-dehydrogenase
MPLVVLYGAGNIGRGFIAPLFTAVGWEVCFVDIDKDRVNAINEQKAYSVFEVNGDQRKEQKVVGIQAVHPDDEGALLQMISQADVMATAVGLHALPQIAEGIAKGLAYRWQDMTKPVDVLICENGPSAAQDLRRNIKQYLPQGLWPSFELDCGCVRTVIGRMIPEQAKTDSLDIDVEPYCHLPTERAAYCAPHPAIPHLDCVDDFDAYMHQKTFIHNGSHAGFAYAGIKDGYSHLPQCLADEDLKKRVYAATEEIIVAMVKVHGSEQRDQCRALRDDLFERYTNTGLNDSLKRIARDPVRKLARNDRLIGAAAFCLEQQVNCPQLCQLIRDACAYKISDGEPNAERWRAWQADGFEAQICGVTGLDAQHALVRMILTSGEDA